MIRVHPTALAEYLDQVRVSPGELRDLYPPAPAATTGQLHRPVAKSTGNNWLGVPALAEELGVTLRTVYAILDAGEIPCQRIRRVIRIKRVDGEAYLDRVKVKPGDLRHLYQQSDQQPDDPQG